jgi:hypothetical protein
VALEKVSIFFGKRSEIGRGGREQAERDNFLAQGKIKK